MVLLSTLNSMKSSKREPGWEAHGSRSHNGPNHGTVAQKAEDALLQSVKRSVLMFDVYLRQQWRFWMPLLLSLTLLKFCVSPSQGR